ncbi:MAG: bifunctional oligoribonuclease/PAP phosphatase NrnA [Clostridiales bacterium]|nr:bifunctional oligoribonuclease/PAP phosphatase NrnA [Clostridiales bacterium]
MDHQQAAALLASQNDILILTHRRPDGDTIGCAAGLCLALRQLGKTAYVFPNEDAHSLFTPYLEGCVAPDGFVPDFVVSVDTASLSLLTDRAMVYADRVDLCIDHHPSQEYYGMHTCLDTGCAACGELLYSILSALGPVTPEIALPLYVAVSTDTGCFAYNNTTPRSHRVAAALMECGIDYRWVNKRHFRTKSYRRLQLEGMLTSSLARYDGGITAIASVTLDMTRALGITEEDVEDISSFVGQVEGVQNAVTVRELKPGECKISLRTSGGLNASHVCALLDGGGHMGAAGCTVYGTAEEAAAAILSAIRQVAAGGA